MYIICGCRHMCICTLITMSLQKYIFHCFFIFIIAVMLRDCSLKSEKLNN